ncbi:MAG: diguanylate cyclase [Gallionella sp.]
MISTAEILDASILIVDDQAANVLLLDTMLRNAGYHCIASTMDPYAVCAMHRANHYDLIILDLMMPGMDGFQVMEELNQSESTGYMPILVVTAQPGHKQRALASGAKDFISKPFDLIEAMTRIHNMLEVRLSYNQLELRNQEQETLALHDELTGLPNRRLLMDRLTLAIAHAHRGVYTMAVMYLDVDEFKQVNDSLGHDAGDALLRMISSRLVRAVRDEDTVARLGGDEFVIVMSEIKATDDVAKLAAKLLLATAKPYYIQGGDVCVTTSIGVSIFPAQGDDADTLLKCADVALYEAKRAGKNSFRISTNTDLQEQTYRRIVDTTSAHWAGSGPSK